MAETLRTGTLLGSRERILESARRLFAEKGFGETSVDEIAEEAGVAKGTIYTHFSSKDELLITILRVGMNEMTEKVHLLMKQNKPFLDRLRDVTLVFMEYIEKHHHFHRVYCVQKEMLPAPISQSPEVRRELYQQFRNFLTVLTVYLEEGIKSGDIQYVSAEEAAYFFPTMVHAANYYNQFSANPKDIKTLANDVYELYLHGFGAKAN